MEGVAQEGAVSVSLDKIAPVLVVEQIQTNFNSSEDEAKAQQ